MNQIDGAEKQTNSTPPQEMARQTELAQTSEERLNLLKTLDATNLDVASVDRRTMIQTFIQSFHPPFSPTAIDTLLQYENTRRNFEPNFDITALPKKRVERIIQRANDGKKELMLKNNKEQKAANSETSESHYKQHIDELKSEGKSNAEIIQILARDPVTPESEKAKLQNFADIMSLASTSQDQQLIAERVNGLDISKLPDPIGFIQTQIFDAPNHKSGFSESFQKNVAQKFNVPQIRNTTVANMEQNLDAKVPIINPETGKVTGYKPAITRNNAPEVRPGIIMYVDGLGNKTYEDLYSGETFSLGGSVAGREIDKMRLQFLSSRPELLNSGIENFFGLNLRNASMPKVHELQKIHKIHNALLGGSRNLRADVMWSDEHKQFSQNLLFLSQFGDTSPLSCSSEQMLKSRQQIGLTNSADPLDINMEVLSATGDYLNAHSNTSGKAAYEELQVHLHKLFPDRISRPENLSDREQKLA